MTHCLVVYQTLKWGFQGHNEHLKGIMGVLRVFPTSENNSSSEASPKFPFFALKGTKAVPAHMPLSLRRISWKVWGWPDFHLLKCSLK